MTDLLVKLYDLPNVEQYLTKLQNEGIIVRRAMSYEKHQVLEWVQDNFGRIWASECDIAFGSRPISCFVSVHRAPHLLCCRALEVQEVRLRTRTPRICSTL